MKKKFWNCLELDGIFQKYPGCYFMNWLSLKVMQKNRDLLWSRDLVAVVDSLDCALPVTSWPAAEHIMEPGNRARYASPNIELPAFEDLVTLMGADHKQNST